MKSTFAETLSVILFPLILSSADVKDIIVIIAGIVSVIWVVVEVICKLREWNN